MTHWDSKSSFILTFMPYLQWQLLICHTRNTVYMPTSRMTSPFCNCYDNVNWRNRKIRKGHHSLCQVLRWPLRLTQAWMSDLLMKSNDSISKHSDFITKVKVLVWPWSLSKRPWCRTFQNVTVIMRQYTILFCKLKIQTDNIYLSMTLAF